MNSVKFLLLLLVALLCQSQLAANVHLVTHLQVPDQAALCGGHTEHEGVHTHHGAAERCLGFLSDAFTSASADTTAEPDCLIFHAVLSLAGALPHTTNDRVIRINQATAQTPYAYLTTATRNEKHQIRAPPHYS